LFRGRAEVLRAHLVFVLGCDALSLRSVELFESLFDLARDEVDIFKHFMALPHSLRKARSNRTEEEIVLRVIVMRPGVATVLIFIKNDVQDPRFAPLQALLIHFSVI